MIGPGGTPVTFTSAFPLKSKVHVLAAVLMTQRTQFPVEAVKAEVPELQTIVVLMLRTRAKLVFSCWQTLTLTVLAGVGRWHRFRIRRLPRSVGHVYGVVTYTTAPLVPDW